MRILIILLLVTSTCYGQQPPQAVIQASRSVGLVSASNGGSIYQGSGTYIGSKIVISANHVVKNTNVSTITVDFGYGPIRNTEVVANKQADQLIIHLEREPRVRPALIRRGTLTPGETIFGYGFAGGTRFQHTRGRFSRYVSAEGQKETMVVSGQLAEQGMSGGGLFDNNGYFIGNLWGSSQDIGGTTGIRVEETKWFLDRCGLFNRNQQCVTGVCPPTNQQYSSPPQQYSPPPEQQYTPVPEQQYRPPPQPSYPVEPQSNLGPIIDRIKNDSQMMADLKGETGDTGPTGPKGPKGDPGQVSQNQIEDIITALVNNPKLKGDKGDTPTITPEMLKEITPEINISNMRMDDDGNVYITYSNGRIEQIGHLKRPDDFQTSERPPVYYSIQPRKVN